MYNNAETKGTTDGRIYLYTMKDAFAFVIFKMMIISYYTLGMIKFESIVLGFSSVID